MSRELQIDEEFKNLLPPLSEEEFAGLEKQILEEGVQDKIVTWNGVIVDGHNRYEICTKHALVCPTREVKFDSRDAAKIWIYNHQNSRRNLEPGQKAALEILRNEARVREEARLRQVQAGEEHGRGLIGGENSLASRDVKLLNEAAGKEQSKGRTAEILAKNAGVGQSTIERTLKVKRDDPELFEQIRAGKITTNTAYKQVKNKNTPREDYADPEKSLLENIPVYNRASLIAELKGSAEMLETSWKQSLEINESMRVKLTKAEKNKLCNAIDHLYRAIDSIKREG